MHKLEQAPFHCLVCVTKIHWPIHLLHIMGQFCNYLHSSDVVGCCVGAFPVFRSLDLDDIVSEMSTARGRVVGQQSGMTPARTFSLLCL